MDSGRFAIIVWHAGTGWLTALLAVIVLAWPAAVHAQAQDDDLFQVADPGGRD